MFFQKLRKQMKWIFVVIAVTFAVGLAYLGGIDLGLGRSADTRRGPVAVVNGVKISRAQLDRQVRDQAESLRAYGQSVRYSMRPELEYYAYVILRDHYILLTEARRQKIKVTNKEFDEEYKKQVENFPSRQDFLDELERNGFASEKEFKNWLRENLMVSKLVDSVGNVKVTDAEVARAYEKITASMILIKPKAEGEAGWQLAERLAKEVATKAKSGQNFAQLAKTFSDDQATKLSGGELGEIGHEQLPPAVDDVAFRLPVGGVSDPIKGPDGYYIVRVSARKEATGPDFEKEKENLRKQLADQRRQEEQARWFASLQAQAKVEILDPVLKARDLVGIGKLDEAIAEYQKALAEQDDPYVRLQLARVYEMKKDKVQMIKELERAAAVTPEDVDIQLALGTAYKDADDKEKALAALTKAAEVAPQYDLQVHSQLSQLFSELGRKDLADQEDKKVNEIYALYTQRLEAAQKAQTEAQKANEPAQNTAGESGTGDRTPAGSASGQAGGAAAGQDGAGAKR